MQSFSYFNFINNHCFLNTRLIVPFYVCTLFNFNGSNARMCILLNLALKCALTFAIMSAQCVQQVYGSAAQ